MVIDSAPRLDLGMRQIDVLNQNILLVLKRKFFVDIFIDCC